MSGKGIGSIAFTGTPELIAAIDKLSVAVRKRVARKAVSMALVPLNKAAKRNCPKETGLLKKSLGKRIKTYRKGTLWGGVGPRTQIVGVGPDGRKRWPAAYAQIVESGTAPHGNHPGTAPRPFLRTAFEQTKGEMQRIAENKVRIELENEARKAASQAGVRH